MCEYAEETLDAQMPDCLWNCSQEGSNWTDPMVKKQCSECWNTLIEPYRSYTELFMVALDYLEREDIGLHKPQFLSLKEEQAILLVRRMLKKEEYLKIKDQREQSLSKVSQAREQRYLDG